MQGTDLVSVSQRWQARITASPDYVIVPHDNVFRMGLHASAISESVYDQFGQYYREFFRRYAGVPVEDAIPGSPVINEDGECYHVQHTRPIYLSSRSQPDPKVLDELRLIRGIGPKGAENLKQRSCRTIPELSHHRRYQKGAAHVLEVLNAGPAGATHLIRSRLGPSHPLGLIASEGFTPEKIRFLDLETLGIFGRPVILFGIGCPGPGGLVIHQFVLRDITEEPAALTAVRELLDGADALVSYNGRSFDLPYLNERFAYYGFDPLPELPHIDLLHYTRRMWKNQIQDCRLSTIERGFLGVEREHDLPGMLVPEWYLKYRDTGNCGPLVPIVRHNEQDIASLPLLLNLLRSKARECC
nr:ribonuclease H-like domain-containing protein [uncultured Methanospirillum sp.]